MFDCKNQIFFPLFSRSKNIFFILTPCTVPFFLTPLNKYGKNKKKREDQIKGRGEVGPIIKMSAAHTLYV
jgi:hypothetical protein